MKDVSQNQMQNQDAERVSREAQVAHYQHAVVKKAFSWPIRMKYLM